MIFLRRWRATGARVVALRSPDAAEMARLHATGFARGWSGSEIKGLLQARGSHALGAKLGSTLLGFVMMRAAADEAEILSIVVDPDWRGCAIARRLLDHALDEAATERARRCFLEVEANNASALALYRRSGFSEAGRRKGYYTHEGGGDAIVMRRDLGDRVPRYRPPDVVAIESDHDE